ncbi:MAG: HupE/UreJ family protein [Gammaproteobacteria bacterium]
MSNKSFVSAVFTAFILFKVPAAHAHAFFSEDVSWWAGFVHPLTGVDHILAGLAVGLWAAQQGGSRLWQLPVAFLSMMMFGVVLGQYGLLLLPNVEIGVAGSLVVLGLMLAFALRLSMLAALMTVSFFALFHGYAHAVEMPANATANTYLLGLLLTSSILLCGGVMIGLWCRTVRYEQILRIGGLAVGITGGLLCM